MTSRAGTTPAVSDTTALDPQSPGAPIHAPAAGSVHNGTTARSTSRLRVLLTLERGWSVTGFFVVAMAIAGVTNAVSLPTFTNGLLLLIMCYGWNLVGGFLGEFSFGHMIFWALGAYSSVLAINHDVSAAVFLPCMIVVAMIAGVLMAVFIKLSGVGGLTLAIFTLVLSEIVAALVEGSSRLGGSEGLIVMKIPGVSEEVMFVVLVGIVGVFMFANVAMSNNRWGRQWLAIRDDRVAAEVAGIRIERQRIPAYMGSAAIFAIGGAYQAYYAGFAIPQSSLDIGLLILATLAVFIGGPGTALGPLLGWVMIFGLQTAAEALSSSPTISLYAQLAQFGVAIVMIRLVIPRLGGDALVTALLRLPRKVRHKRPNASQLTTDDQAVESPVEVIASLAWADASASKDGAGLVIENIHKSFGRVRVLEGVSFGIKRGEIVGIVGPNGAGKSTLCNILSGIERPSRGSVLLDGKPMGPVSASQRAAHGYGRSFQSPRLFKSLSLVQNLMLGLRHLRADDAVQLLERMGIPNGGDRRGDDSQFFARRLTEVAKASIQGSMVLLLDEPLAGLTDEEHGIVLTVARGAAEQGACVAIVDHLIPVLAPAVDRIVALHEGRIIADDIPDAVLRDPAVIDAYLGSATHGAEDSE